LRALAHFIFRKPSLLIKIDEPEQDEKSNKDWEKPPKDSSSE